MDHDEMRAAMRRATEPQVVIHSDPEGRWVLWQADCRTILSRLPDNCVDAIVTDPPYELGFMGKAWDASGIAYNVEMWREALRVLKPGGHLLAFGGTRTYHRMACAIEDAGFIAKDSVAWVYGQGFPKSLDVSKAIDKQAGAKREVVGKHPNPGATTPRQSMGDGWQIAPDITAPATDAAKQWQGWGTALKPAMELVMVARKPLEGTVAANVLKWGTGALNIDGCRVEAKGENFDNLKGRPILKINNGRVDKDSLNGPAQQAALAKLKELGRWPANFIHDGSDEVLALFPETAGGARPAKANKRTGAHYEGGWGTIEEGPRIEFDAGSAARFFYCAKASKAERNAGLGHLEPQKRYKAGGVGGTGGMRSVSDAVNAPPQHNHHPTVKPIALMRYLIRLVTPPGGVVLDPFAGSGTTMVAALMEGAQPWGCEMTADYVPIILGRVGWALDEVESRIEGTL